MTTVAFYVKAGVETGYGHVVRCLALAKALECAAGGIAECSVVFYTNDAGAQKATGWPVIIGQPFVAHDIIIVDLEGGCPPELANHLRPLCDALVILNGVGYPDGDPGRLLSDLCFYQGVTDRPCQLDWTGFRGKWFEGPGWLILGKDYQAIKAEPGAHERPRVIICGGGSDPKNVTELALRALAETNYEVRAIIGPAKQHGWGYNHQNTTVIYDPPNVALELVWADVAIVSYGMMAFECLAVGLPVVALSISEDHAMSALLVARKSGGALLSLGRAESTSVDDINWAVNYQLTLAKECSELARLFVDGRGARRVADKILQTLEEKRGSMG